MDIRKNITALQNAKKNTTTPLMTYARFCEEVGYANAGDTIALAVSHASWDGRISKRNADWAEDRLEHRSYTQKDKDNAYVCIHMCHLDQIADIARKLNY